MTTRLLAVAALLLIAGSAHLARGQEQTADGQCNCPKCQAARAAAMGNQATAAENDETLTAQPAGMFSAEPVGLFAPGGLDFLKSPSSNPLLKSQHQVAKEAVARQVQPAGHTAASVAATGYHGPSYVGPGPGSHGRRPGASSYGSGTFPYGSPYDHFHAGKPFDGGRYGYFGGAHRTPGYPHHHHHREYVGPQGPPSAQVAYPYYTVRGPRDFFMDNPPSIGR